MIVELAYGKGAVRVDVPGDTLVAAPKDLPGVADARAEIRRAMDAPIDTPRLRDLARGKPDAVVVINDVTRPAPSGEMLDEILADLVAAGILEERVTVLIACGTHRTNTHSDIVRMVGGDLASRLTFVSHDCEQRADLVYVGETGTGFPVWLHAAFARASLKILTGVIAPHHGAGYSGGRKCAIPGIAGLETIRRFHSFPICPYEPAMGWMAGNDMHREALEGARLAGVDFILNVVENSAGEVVQAVAGDLEAAHLAGVATCEANWRLSVPRHYDVVIVSPGGYPRDINLHQAQKAISTAETVAERGGVIVLIAECAEGSGKFAPRLMAARSPRDAIERFEREGFTDSSSFKAFYCARALERYTVIVACSGIPSADLERMFFVPAASPQAAVDRALALGGSKASVLVLPYAVNCIPRVGP